MLRIFTNNKQMLASLLPDYTTINSSVKYFITFTGAYDRMQICRIY